MVGSIKDGRGDFVELVFADSFDVYTISCAQDGVKDSAANDGLDCFDDTLLCANDGLVDHVQAVGLVMGVCLHDDCRWGCFRLVRVCRYNVRPSVIFFDLLKMASAMMASVERTWLVIFLAFSRSFCILFPASLTLKIVSSNKRPRLFVVALVGDILVEG